MLFHWAEEIVIDRITVIGQMTKGETYHTQPCILQSEMDNVTLFLCTMQVYHFERDSANVLRS